MTNPKVENAQYSEEDIAKYRCILLTKNRSKQLEISRKAVLGYQWDDELLGFTTSFSYQILHAFDNMFKRYSKTANELPMRFDMLFAFTYTLDLYDTWMHDHEDFQA